LKKKRKKLYKTRAVRTIRHFLLVKFLVFLLAAVVVCPYRFSLFIGRVLGYWACYLAPYYRKKADENLKKAFGWNPLKIRDVREKVFAYTGMNLVDFALINFRSGKFWKKRIEINGSERIREYLAQGKGIIYLTAHIGNWELMGAYLAMIGYPINVVARKIYEPRLNRLLVSMRSRHKVNTLYRSGRGNARKMMKALKRGEVLGVLIDQDTKVGGVFVDFFGRPAYTPTAVSQFSRIKNTVVLPGFIHRKHDYTHRIDVLEPVTMSGSEKEDTQNCTRVIEEYIKQHPWQWVWMHPRWKRKPL